MYDLLKYHNISHWIYLTAVKVGLVKLKLRSCSTISVILQTEHILINEYLTGTMQ